MVLILKKEGESVNFGSGALDNVGYLPTRMVETIFERGEWYNIGRRLIWKYY